MLGFNHFTHLTFDCYGTLIDWEAGILGAVTPVLERHGVTIEPVEVLRLYTSLEAELEAGEYRPYREVLRGVAAGMGQMLGFAPTETDLEALPTSVGDWPPFPDTVAALRRLQARYGPVVVSNIDDALFAATQRALGVTFDAVITAEQVRSYKPAPAHFHAALARLGVPVGQVLHVAQSLYHDHVPAKALGFRTVWVNRPSRLPGTGLALPAEARPDVEVGDLESLAWLAGL
jgi:2-haloacid dehalogenase